jgi:hypothetical protein
LAEIEPYPTAAGVEAAIKDAAKKAAAADPSLDTNERIRLEYFNRFLSRIFSEGAESEWPPKGGTGMLARRGTAFADEVAIADPSSGTRPDKMRYRSHSVVGTVTTTLPRAWGVSVFSNAVSACSNG